MVQQNLFNWRFNCRFNWQLKLIDVQPTLIIWVCWGQMVENNVFTRSLNYPDSWLVIVHFSALSTWKTTSSSSEQQTRTLRSSTKLNCRIMHGQTGLDRPNRAWMKIKRCWRRSPDLTKIPLVIWCHSPFSLVQINVQLLKRWSFVIEVILHGNISRWMKFLVILVKAPDIEVKGHDIKV